MDIKSEEHRFRRRNYAKEIKNVSPFNKGHLIILIIMIGLGFLLRFTMLYS